jgi:predicted DNA-binding protein
MEMSKKQMSVGISPESYEVAKQLAQETRRSIAGYVEWAIERQAKQDREVLSKN